MTEGPSKRLPIAVHRCVRSAEAVLARAGIHDEPLVAAVSGGGDSMALLEVVSILAGRLRLEVHVASIDHRLRPEAAAELEIVAAVARARGAAFHAAAIDPGGGDEDTLRNRRHEALEQIRRTTGSRFVLTGHTSDDQLETIVFRFLRGAGLGGLAGMREIRPPFARPLLGLRRSDLRDLLRERGVAWIEDPTNDSDRYARGRLRTRVLPAIGRAFGTGTLEHLLDVAPRWRADEDFLERETDRWLAFVSRRGPSGIEIDAEALSTAHVALRARVLRRWLASASAKAPGSRELAVVERWLDEGPRSGSGIDVAGARITLDGERLVCREHRAARERTEDAAGRKRVDIASSSDDALPGRHSAKHSGIESGQQTSERDDDSGEQTG